MKKVKLNKEFVDFQGSSKTISTHLRPSDYMDSVTFVFHIREDIYQWLCDHNIPYSLLWESNDRFAAEWWLGFQQTSHATLFKLTWL